MEDPVTPGGGDAQSRRKSGRVVKQPILYQDDPNVQHIQANGSGKRKRGTRNGSATEQDENDVNGEIEEDSSDEEDEDESESEPDEPKKRRRAPGKGRKASRKPATKKPKTKDDAGTLELAMRPAVNGVKKPTKPRKTRPKARPSQAGEQGLYSEVFAQGKTGDEVAVQWLNQFVQDPVSAMRDFVNFILRCTGFDGTVDNQDIEDVDHVAGKLEDLQDVYTAQQIHDYPLIARTKGAFSRNVMTDFVESVLETAHQTETLYNDVALIENMQAWVATMTSSNIRPFRHTATVVGLAIGTALCGLDKQYIDSIATTTRQKEGEQKRKNANKERIKSFQAKIKEQEERKTQVEAWIKDVFDSIFVMRYRDVDARVRIDCASALGSWIHTCPETFFTGEYIRYLGWLLSDVIPAARSEVLKQLTRLYEDPENAGRVRAFTERFKGRMVEMACQDADSGVRAAAIELLDTIREMGFLEPADVDAVGKLIFDTELRVRKSVTGFFAANIDDVLDAAAEEIGGEEVLNEALGEGDDEDFEQPRRSWLKFKSLGETLEAYDDEDAEAQEAMSLGANHLVDTGGGTRFTIAGEVVCAGIAEVRNWESLAGYLLYDFSKGKKGRSGDPMAVFKKKCAPSERQESILLEILQVAVRSQLEEANGGPLDKKKAPRKADESRAVQEATAQSLAQFLPKLLGKYGSSPSTVIAVLRLEQLLNMDIFQELRQDSSEFAGLLDDISKQFMTHADSSVLQAARNSLLHAKEADEFADVTESKVEEVWTDALKPVQQAASSNKPNTKLLANALERIQNLASIADCVEQFEAELPGNKRKSSSARSIHDYLCALIVAYKDDESEDSERIILNSMQALLFYTLWKIKHLKDVFSEGETADWTPGQFPSILVDLIEARQKLDDVRLAAISCLLDTHLAFTSLRHISSDNQEVNDTIKTIVQEVPATAKKAITASFVAAEKDFAKKSGRNLDKVGDEAVQDVNGEPDAPESESDEEEEEEEDDDEQKKALLIQAERQLCELTGKIVLAIIGRVLDVSDPGKGKLRRRIQRNKTKLGAYFKEVLNYLDEPKKKSRAQSVSKPKAPVVNGTNNGDGAKSGKVFKSNENVEASDDEADDAAAQNRVDEEDEVVEGDENDLRRKGVLVDEDGDDNEQRNDDEEDDVMGD